MIGYIIFLGLTAVGIFLLWQILNLIDSFIYGIVRASQVKQIKRAMHRESYHRYVQNSGAGRLSDLPAQPDET